MSSGNRPAESRPPDALVTSFSDLLSTYPKISPGILSKHNRPWIPVLGLLAFVLLNHQPSPDLVVKGVGVGVGMRGGEEICLFQIPRYLDSR